MTQAIESVLSRVAASGDERWILSLLHLAWEAEGPLRQRLLDEAAGMLARLPARRWTRLDELARPGWGCYSVARQSMAPGDSPEFPIVERLHAGTQRWLACPSLDAIREGLGSHAAPIVLASMHPNGRVRQAAVLELAGDASGLSALLLRANDWVAPIRDDALMSLHELVEPAHVDSWLRAMPLLLRLEACGRGSHGPLIDRVGALFRVGDARARLLHAVTTLDAPAARAAAAMALRVHGPNDRDTLSALLRCPDVTVRSQALHPSRTALDGELLGVALADPIPAIRRRALDVLRERGSAEFVERLTAACFDPSAAVREYAVFHLQKATGIDAASLAAEARRRLREGRGDVLGPLGLLCDLDGHDCAADAWAFAEHPRGQVRFCAKQCLIRSCGDDDVVDGRLLDDRSPKIARRLIELLRARGVGPDLAEIARRVESSSDESDAVAWLSTLATGETWAALPYLVHAMDDRRSEVAARSRELVDVVTGRAFRSYVDPGERALGVLAAALRTCRDARAARVTDWIRAVTGRRTWPSET